MNDKDLHSEDKVKDFLLRILGDQDFLFCITGRSLVCNFSIGPSAPAHNSIDCLVASFTYVKVVCGSIHSFIGSDSDSMQPLLNYFTCLDAESDGLIFSCHVS